jgi:hypothetical protein
MCSSVVKWWFRVVAWWDVLGLVSCGCGWVTLPYARTGYPPYLTHEVVVANPCEDGITVTISCVRCRGTAAGNHFVRKVAVGREAAGGARGVRPGAGRMLRTVITWVH